MMSSLLHIQIIGFLIYPILGRVISGSSFTFHHPIVRRIYHA